MTLMHTYDRHPNSAACSADQMSTVHQNGAGSHVLTGITDLHSLDPVPAFTTLNDQIGNVDMLDPKP